MISGIDLCTQTQLSLFIGYQRPYISTITWYDSFTTHTHRNNVCII